MLHFCSIGLFSMMGEAANRQLDAGCTPKICWPIFSLFMQGKILQHCLLHFGHSKYECWGQDFYHEMWVNKISFESRATFFGMKNVELADFCGKLCARGNPVPFNNVLWMALKKMEKWVSGALHVFYSKIIKMVDDEPFKNSISN